MSAVRQEYGKIEGNLTVEDDLVLFGMCTGNITVASSGVLTLHGMCTGNLEVLPGGTAYLNGMVAGNVLNLG